jgi:SAM-dependent methyltransferase
LGAKFVHLVDLDKNIKISIKKNLKKYSKNIKIHIQSIEKTNFPDNYFDFILCQGVIHHAKDPKKCISEIKRILKPRGKCLLMVHGKGGLMTDFVHKILRPQYKKDKTIKKFIDSIIYNKLSIYNKFYLKNFTNDSKKIVNFLTKYIDHDLFLTMQDRVLAPKYELFDYEELLKLLRKNSFTNIYRISKKVKFKNLRQLLAPFYLYHNHNISKALYGDGNITLMMTKK